MRTVTARATVLGAGALLAAVVALFVQGDIAPWGVAGLGLPFGALTARAEEARTFLLASAALTVALRSTQVQPYNPAWLTAVVLCEKVFITHALLAVSVVHFIGRDRPTAGGSRGDDEWVTIESEKGTLKESGRHARRKISDSSGARSVRFWPNRWHFLF